MKSLFLGNLGQWRGTEGNASFGLITQRSKVQILPPRPNKSTSYEPPSSFLKPTLSTVATFLGFEVPNSADAGVLSPVLLKITSTTLLWACRLSSVMARPYTFIVVCILACRIASSDIAGVALKPMILVRFLRA
jgi:hypothetical protein